MRDQAELQGHLQRVSDLGLTLLGATPVAEEAQTASSMTSGVTGEGLPATIVPRWEWRTFGADDSAFAERSAESLQESDELYLLSAQSDASVKVRSELMDVKRLEHVNDEGLEQWLPVHEGALPHPGGRRRLRARRHSASPFRRSRAASTRSTSSLPRSSIRARSCWQSRCTSDASTTGSTAAWRS